ncbi:hypothetical protein SKAU_G00073220 [Synaphobranchus kaupii]|uniref:Uncharacterized protein n=1 Tax=Synaphobranchus kaupii TaxID=118154 RepID=A0A9Q1JBY4_SYNKA|nr:hypothetical protein SKAU_G00073220 [Synaphobranchus kaupii]
MDDKPGFVSNSIASPKSASRTEEGVLVVIHQENCWRDLSGCFMLELQQLAEQPRASTDKILAWAGSAGEGKVGEKKECTALTSDRVEYRLHRRLWLDQKSWTHKHGRQPFPRALPPTLLSPQQVLVPQEVCRCSEGHLGEWKSEALGVEITLHRNTLPWR